MTRSAKRPTHRAIIPATFAFTNAHPDDATPKSGTQLNAAPAFLDGGGHMGERIRQLDWASTAIGDPKHWPGPLRTALRIMLNTNHPVFVFWGVSHTCFYNDAYARSLGPERHPAILGMPGETAWSEIWPIISPQIDFVMRGDGATWHENQLVPMTRFGQVEDVYWTYSYGPIHDEDAPHGVGGVLVLCTETTERVMAEERMRIDAERWRTLFDQSPGFICVLKGPEHRFEYGNGRYLALIGRMTMPVGVTVRDAIPEAVGQGFVDLLDTVYASGTSHTASGARITLAGVERFLDFVYQPVRAEDGSVTGILVQGYDVTERELSQCQLRESASRLLLATEAAELGIHEYDLASGRLVLDARVRRLWGLGEAEEVSFGTFIEVIVEEDRAAIQEALDRALAPDGDGLYSAEYRVRDRLGKTRWVRATGHVDFDGRTPVRLIGTTQDISRQKFNEAELRETDRRKDIFLATLAHELRNPLAPIRNAAQVLSMSSIGQPEVDWAQQVITRQSQHMASLLNDLLDVARLAQGRLSLKCERIEMRSVLDSAWETVQPLLLARQHRLQMQVPATGLAVLGDPVRLSQVFTNLLTNSIKYTEPGGTIDVVAHAAASGVTITVRDSGMGMNSDTLAEVFGMFRQSEYALERAEGGLGIGLALVRSIVELHGGTVSAFSEGAGMGSLFTVTLPCDDGTIPPPASDAAGMPEPQVDAGKRILIADDNRDAAESLSMLLEMHGYHVRVAINGEQAIQLASEFAPDVMLLDIGMPLKNGYEVAQTIRQAPVAAQPRIIALTGWGMPADRARAIEAGFDAHLTKPPDIRLLLEELEK